jgi:large subunit ribosomal protein L33
MAAKSYEKFKMVSSAGTGFFKTFTRSRKNRPAEKRRTKMYDPKVRKHVEFVEEKIK